MGLPISDVTFVFVAGSVTVGSAQPSGIFSVATSRDRQPDTGAAVPALGGQAEPFFMSFAKASDQVPGAINTGNIYFQFNLATPLPIGAQIVLMLPANYFSAVDATKESSVCCSSTIKCVLRAGAAVIYNTVIDTLTCTTTTGSLPAGRAILTLLVGTATTGLPQAAAKFNVYTTTPLLGAPGKTTASQYCSNSNDPSQRNKLKLSFATDHICQPSVATRNCFRRSILLLQGKNVVGRRLFDLLLLRHCPVFAFLDMPAFFTRTHPHSPPSFHPCRHSFPVHPPSMQRHRRHPRSLCRHAVLQRYSTKRRFGARCARHPFRKRFESACCVS
jgi:hypothetical protein